jgi:hypothetical protein
MPYEKEEITTIQIRKTTRDKLKELGKKGETYDDIVNALLSAKERAELSS